MVQRNTANTANIRTSELPNQRLIHDDKTAFDRKYTTESRDCKVKAPSLPLKMIAELAKKKTVFSEELKNFVELEKQKKFPKEILTIKDTKEWKELHSNEARSNTEKP
ncbi:hypothetical protein D1002_02420 [Riemerella anatipestifer]|nr:hypothetical protein [Riemerella anatipestifer]